MSQYYVVKNADQLKSLIEFASQALLAGETKTYKVEKPETHTNWTQFKSMHLWFEMVAEFLNASGLDQRAVLKPEAMIPWTAHAFKENVWKPVQRQQTGKESTKEISGTESGNISEAIVRIFADRGIELPQWPQEEK